MSAFSIQVDTPQMRLLLDGVSTLVGKQDWDLGQLDDNGTYLDGSTGTVLLLPGALDGPNWTTSNTGIYAKLPSSDFTLTNSNSNVSNVTLTNNSDGSDWIKAINSTSAGGAVKAITTYNVAVNQAMVVSLFIGNGTPTSTEGPSFGWGSSGDYTTGVSLRSYYDGSFDIWKAGVKLANFTVSGQNADYGQTDGQISSQTPNQYINFLLIPCRGRELLILTSNGGGYSYIFEDIPEGNPSNVPITPAAPFWFESYPGANCTFQMALCQYVSSGNAIGKQSFWRYDPGASPTFGFQTWLNQDLEGCTTSVLVADGLNPSVAYINNTNGVRLNVTMTGTTITSGPYTPTVTPFLYGVRGYTLPQLAMTWGENPLDVTTFALELSVSDSDSVGGLHAMLKVKDPLGIIAAGVALDPTNQPGAGIQWQKNRAWRIYDDTGTQIIEGRNLKPSLSMGTYIDSSGNAVWGTVTNPAEFVDFEIRDLWDALEKFVFKDQIPLDGFTLLDALVLVTDNAGITDSTNQLGLGVRTWNMSTSLATYVLPQGGSVTNSDYNFLIESGDKASDIIDRLFKTYAGNAFLSLVPSGGWSQPNLLVEADMPSTAALDLYDSYATALAASVSDPDYLDYFRKVDVQTLEPEANDIYVQGFDYRFKRPILSHKVDVTNANPTVIPAARTPQWLGERRSYAWNDPSLATQGACNYAIGLLYARLTIARSLVEIECDFQSVLPRGTLVKLHFAANGGIYSNVDGSLVNPAVCRVKSWSARFVYTANDGRGLKWRPTKYVLQFGQDVSLINVTATTARAIAFQYAQRILSNYSQWGDDNDKQIWRRPYISQEEG